MKKIQENHYEIEKKILINKILKMNKEKINFMGKKASEILPKINRKAEKLYGSNSFILKNLDPFD